MRGPSSSRPSSRRSRFLAVAMLGIALIAGPLMPVAAFADESDDAARWDFSGGAASDVSWHGHDGTAAAGVSFASSGAVLNGTDSGEITVEYAASYQPEAAGDGGTWRLELDDVTPAVVGGTHRTIMGTRGADDGWAVYLTPQKQIEFWIGQTSSSTKYLAVSSGVVAAVGATYDIIVERTGNEVSIAVSGAASGTRKAVLGGGYSAVKDGTELRLRQRRQQRNGVLLLRLDPRGDHPHRPAHGRATGHRARTADHTSDARVPAHRRRVRGCGTSGAHQIDRRRRRPGGLRARALGRRCRGVHHLRHRRRHRHSGDHAVRADRRRRVVPQVRRSRRGQPRKHPTRCSRRAPRSRNAYCQHRPRGVPVRNERHQRGLHRPLPRLGRLGATPRQPRAPRRQPGLPQHRHRRGVRRAPQGVRLLGCRGPGMDSAARSPALVGSAEHLLRGSGADDDCTAR